MIDRVLRGWQIDPRQFRALLRITLVMDIRTGGGLGTRSEKKGGRFRGMVGLLFFYSMFGLFLSITVIENPDTYLTGSIAAIMTVFAITTAVLVEFQAIVISPEDFPVLSHRPISSRTYFAARLANVLLFLGTMTLAISLLPSLAFALRWGFRPFAGIAALLSFQLVGLTSGLAIVFIYLRLMYSVHPKKLKRVFSYVQLLLSTVVYGSGLLFTTVLNSRVMESLTFPRQWWHVVLPTSWYADIIRLGGGEVNTETVLSLLLAVGTLIGLLVLAGGRISMRYSQRLAELLESGEAAAGKKPASGSLPFFRRNEPRAMAMLIRNQFRHDYKFRMSILAVVPLTVLYIVAGLSKGGGLADPFVDPGTHISRAHLLYFALAFFPILLMTAMTRSDSWRASWIFHATPSDKGRLVLAMKNFLVIYFVVPYLAGLAVVFAFYFDGAGHVIVHSLVLFLLTHAVLQLLVIVNPALPFSQPAKKGERSASVFKGVLAALIGMGLFMPIIMFLVYPYRWVTLGAIGVLLFVNLALEHAASGRVRDKASRFEYSS